MLLNERTDPDAEALPPALLKIMKSVILTSTIYGFQD